MGSPGEGLIRMKDSLSAASHRLLLLFGASLTFALTAWPAPAAALSVAALLTRLAEADRQWIPTREILPHGGVRYHYKRRAGDPELGIGQIRELIANPPTFGREQAAIRALLSRLLHVGVVVQLTEPRKQGAAAEWDPAQRTIRIRPRVVGKGSREFAKVLNHEAIHVAQSCFGGRLQGSPRPLGLNDALPPTLASVLNEPLYQEASALERRLEREAYAHQDRLELGVRLVERHCLTGKR